MLWVTLTQHKMPFNELIDLYVSSSSSECCEKTSTVSAMIANPDNTGNAEHGQVKADAADESCDRQQ